MAVPTRRQVMKREKMKKVYSKNHNENIDEKSISEEEEQERIKKLKELGLIK